MYDPDKGKLLLTGLNLAACAVHLLSGAAGTALARASNPKVPCIVPFVDLRTAPHGNSTETFVPAPSTVFRVGSLTGLLLFAWITAAFHLVYIVQIHSPRFQEAQRRLLGGGGVNPVRWVEYTITAGIMAAFANLLIGISDFYIFLKVLCANAAMQMIGFALELLDVRDPLQKRLAGILWNQASVLNLVNIAILLTQLFGSKTHSNVFYYNILPYALLFNTFGAVAWLNFKRAGPFASGVYTECWYIGLSLGTKLAVFWLGFATWRGLEESRGFAPKTRGVSWDAVRYAASYGPLGLMLAAAAYEYARARQGHRATHVAKPHHKTHRKSTTVEL
jgi:hypothetical protein